MKNEKGFTLTELLIVLAIISILAMIGIPAYLGQQSRAARTEAFKNLESLRLLEENFFAENAAYAPGAGACAANNAGNVALIQNELPGFQPGSGLLNFSYCIEFDVDLAGNLVSPCFRARAFGNDTSRVPGETYAVDCNNDKTY